MKELAHNLRKYRKLKGETQLSLANKVGVTKTTIAHIEQNIKDSSIKLLQNISDVLNIKVKDLFEDIPESQGGNDEVK